MAEEHLLRAIFARFGVPISEAEARAEQSHAPREAVLMLLANREIAARFDAAHGRPPNDDDLDELVDVYESLRVKGD